MRPSYIALTTLTNWLRVDELTRVAAALQTQVTRDFAPEWGGVAVVTAAPFESIPAGHVPIIVQDTLETEGVNGFHRTSGDDTPYIIVPYGPSWSLTVSHELLRMLANPSGSTRVPGSSCLPGQGCVEYLLDVCAPCQDVAAAYAIDGVPVSDFCTKAFYAEPGSVASGHSGLSLTGALRLPLEPAANGVVTWLADDELLYQARADHQGRIRLHGGFSAANRGPTLLRELVDQLTPQRPARLSNASLTSQLIEAGQNARRVRLANLSRFRDDIAWRFGHPSVMPTEAGASLDIRRLDGRPFKAYGAAEASQHCEEEAETSRSAC